MWRLFYLGVCGAMLAGIIHIVIILLIPTFSSKDAARQIAKIGEVNQFQLIEDGRKIGISDSDPYFRLAVCRFDLIIQSTYLVEL